jgi:hypothetical protein
MQECIYKGSPKRLNNKTNFQAIRASGKPEKEYKRQYRGKNFPNKYDEVVSDE